MNKKINIPSNLKNVKGAVNDVIGLLKDLGTEESDIFDIRLSMEEALINAIKYGNKFDENLDVSVDIFYDKNRITVAIEDKGAGFDYQNMPDPTNEENILKGRGRGVFLIKHLMDKVEFSKKGNRIEMTKHLKTKKESLQKGGI